MKTGLIILGVVVVAALAFGGKVVGIRNSLVGERQAVQGQWAQVDVALQRRADLVPNLVETVKGIAKQEQQVFSDIANARAAMMGAKTPGERIQANSQLEGALGRLMVVVENYPQLKSNENFLRLQDELAGTENRISVERRRYNEAVQRYNTQIEIFPNNLVASMFGFTKENDFFRADPASKTAPKVAF